MYNCYSKGVIEYGNQVKQVVNDESMLKEMCEEAFDFSQSREVQAMLLAEKMAIADWNSAKETAKAEGRAEGLAEGQEETNKLYSWLLSADRIEDAKKATKDVAYRKQLLDELNSIK